MAWWNVILEYLLGVLTQSGYLLSVQFLDLGIFWQLLPIYSSWFAVQFITRNREEEDLANRFMNGFALLWVGFQLGTYIIDNFFTDPYIWVKAIIVIGLFVYAIFIMRLTLLKRDITRYIARIGEVSAVNIAAMLFIQDLLVINNALQFSQLVIGFISIYALLDYGIQRLVDYLYTRVKLPVTEEAPEPVIKEPTPPPRYERITKPEPPKPIKPMRKPIIQQIKQPQPTMPRPTAPATKPPAAIPTTPVAPVKKPVKKAPQPKEL